MKNKDLEKGYNQSVEAKKTNKLAMILITVFSGVITLTCLIMYMISNIYIADKVKVVDTRGVQMESNLVRQRDLVKTGIQNHIQDALFYSNSFQRETIESNQKRTLMLMDKESAYRIFQTYKKEGIYNDAIDRGHIYKVEKTEVTNLSDKGEPYSFVAKSILVSIDGRKKEYFTIVSKGDLTFRKPTFPYNSWGMWITNFRQKSSKIVADE